MVRGDSHGRLHGMLPEVRLLLERGAEGQPDAGEMLSPEQVFAELDRCARKFGYRKVRVSGNEPTLAPDHLMELISLAEEAGYLFILETNGILVDRGLAEGLARFGNVHVRVSLKGTDEEEFSRLTGAVPEAFGLQLAALRNLLDAGVPCHPAVMLSFSPPDAVEGLRERLAEIDRDLAGALEEEYVFLYPHVAERLRRAGLKPLVAFTPDGIPTEFV